ncbi:MAG: aminodeoxychorismate/anthranilate synthase component II [Bacteroidetes bacterium]|nr:aminodeoxychorismate/anthranilate synthase component II [Bacteroidota bacterium]
MDEKIHKSPRVLIFDNYDSFTYNLVHLVEKILHTKIDVALNDQITLKEIDQYDKIILSPGPGIPSEAGLLLPLIKKYFTSKSILGVCLGHQAIAEALGGSLINLQEVFHGMATPVHILHRTPRSKDIFKGIEEVFDAGRYHSWVVDEKTLPKDLIITARDENKWIMAFRHKVYPLHGVQFHPESILTPDGEQIIRNWLSMK